MKQKVGLIRIAAAMLVICLLSPAVLPAWAAQTEPLQSNAEKPLRVGFFAMDGYHMIDDRGRRSGYGYDYLQYLSRYTNFSYEYVGYDKGWGEMQDMLEAGEIDLLTSAQKTPERIRRFDFSDQPIGTSAAILTVKAGDNRYMVDDYTKLDGIRIGVLEGNSRNWNLAQFSREHGFQYRPVYFESSEALAKELKEGDKIDAAFTSNLRKIEDEWIIATFDVTPFYIIVQKGNKPLLDEINKAVARLQMDHKDLPTTLIDRYYAPDSGDEIAYSAEERNYIEEHRKNGQAVKVLLNSGREPVAYTINGKPAGIIPEIADEVMRRTGLLYELSDLPPTEDARGYLMRGEADARFDGTSDFNEAESYGLCVTDPYLELPLSYVTLKSFTGEPKSVAVVRNSDVVEEYVEEFYKEAAITKYDSVDECLEAILNNSQDAAFLQTYIAQRLVNSDVKNRVKEQLAPGYKMSFAVSVRRDDPILFSILEKAVLSMGQEEINQIVREQTSYLSREISLMGYLYTHPVFWIGLLTVTAVFAIVLVLYFSRRRNFILEQEKRREFERFISYVCKANNCVMELDPSRKLYWLYQVENKTVHYEKKVVDEELYQMWWVHPEDRDNIKEMTCKEEIDRLIRNGEEIYFECRVKIKKEDLQYQWIAFTLLGVPQEENSAGRLMVFVKNIDRVKKEEAEKRQALMDALAAAQKGSQARGSFMSRMTHEIRTPLNAIIGYLTIAGADLHNPGKIGECLKKSEFAAHQLLGIINNVLDLSSIESGKLKIAHEMFDLRQLLSGMTSIFHTQCSEKGVKFRIRLKDLTEEGLVGDQLRLSQILMNLLSNAVKFTPAGGQVTLSVIQKGMTGQSVYMQFKVEDTGIGMSEEYKKRLFMPFEQQDANTALKFGGTGLGLSITKNLVTMMGGAIDVRSEEGLGTAFIVSLPFDVKQEKSQEAMELYDFSSLRALVFYDENSDYGYVQTLLTRFGVTSDIVLNQEDALWKIRENKNKGGNYNLCLIDWDILHAGGTEIVKQIREAAAPDRLIVLAAAYEAVEGTQEKGMIDFVIHKPVFQSSLFDILSYICHKIEPEKTEENEQEDYGLSGVRILMAEDNLLNMEIAREILTGYGLEIDGAQNGQEALELFEQSEEGAYQAILMDIQMPVLNGYQAAGRIRACSHPQAQSIPIVALTADAFAEDVNRALASGMNGHVSKPVDFAALCETLARLIKG